MKKSIELEAAKLTALAISIGIGALVLYGYIVYLLATYVPTVLYVIFVLSIVSTLIGLVYSGFKERLTQEQRRTKRRLVNKR